MFAGKCDPACTALHSEAYQDRNFDSDRCQRPRLTLTVNPIVQTAMDVIFERSIAKGSELEENQDRIRRLHRTSRGHASRRSVKTRGRGDGGIMTSLCCP